MTHFSMTREEEMYTSALTSTKNTMLKTCATIAITEEVRQRWLQLVSTSTSLTTQTACVKTATFLSIILRERRSKK